MRAPSWGTQLVFCIGLGFTNGYLMAHGPIQSAPTWARVFWALLGFCQGYLVCLWTPLLQDWAVPRLRGWRERRRLRPGRQG